MRAVSVFSRLLGLDEIRGTSGAVSSDIKGILLGCPPSTPAVPYLDPRCPLSRPPLPFPFLTLGGL